MNQYTEDKYNDIVVYVYQISTLRLRKQWRVWT